MTQPVQGRLGRAVALLLPVIVAGGACAQPGPAISSSEAADLIRAWLPAAEPEIEAREHVENGMLVDATVSGEPLRFRFRHADERWSLDGLIAESGLLGHAEARAEWLRIVRTARKISFVDFIHGKRPAAPLEVVLTGLHVAAVSVGEIRLRADDAVAGDIVITGRHFDALPVSVGDPVAVQVQGLAEQEDGTWVPERREIPGELMVELEPMDMTLLALLKLRFGARVVPVPYLVPDMQHDGHAH